MCGITGIVGQGINSDDKQTISRMVDSMGHRGPDGNGVKLFEQCALGHVRLSIIDLSTGHQPMLSEDEDLAITFNGEIYGYQAIMDRLAVDYQFRTSSDTEVVLNLYKAHGTSMMKHLPGMFAFAIWDEKNRSLFCARDRFGEKPFYYAQTECGKLIFASEIKTILASKMIQPKLCYSSLNHYLRHLYVHPNTTIYSNIKVLPPGHCMEYKNGQLSVSSYWEIPHENLKIDENEAAAELERLLEKSVDKQLVADVPVGIFLSGGLDSSSIVAAASKAGKKLKTFSFGFGDSINELPFARAIADKYQTEHTELFARDFDIPELLQQMTGIYDEPFADSSNIPTYLISKEAVKHVKVVLGGDAGDELLGGYNRYRILQGAVKASALDSKLSFLWKVVAKAMRYAGADQNLDYSLRAQGISLKGKYPDFSRLISNLNVYFSDSDLMSLGLKVDSDVMPEITGSDILNEAMRFDSGNYMPGNILVKTDRAAMANSLELRAPFLDVELSEFCLKLPSSLKLKKGQTKYLLRKAYSRNWPKKVQSHGKQGFGAPVGEWLKLPGMAPVIERCLKSKSAVINSILEPEAVAKFAAGNDYKTWSLLVLALWLEQNPVSELGA